MLLAHKYQDIDSKKNQLELQKEFQIYRYNPLLHKNDIIFLDSLIFPDSRNKIMADLNDTLGWVIIFDNQLIGYILYGNHNNKIHVHELGVNEKFRGKQLGSTLLLIVLREADFVRKQVSLYVEDGKTRDKLIKYYSKFGFVNTGMRESIGLTLLVKK